MSDYCEKCKRCHDDGLCNDEECCYYGEPNGCNHPNHGYGVIVDKYEALQKENAELRECLKEALSGVDVLSDYDGCEKVELSDVAKKDSDK